MAKKSVSKRERAESRRGEVRCLNCFERYRVPPKADRFACPACGWEWRVSWVSPELAKIRGPMWEKLEF
jgi:rRNA maturation endonuclease Nob1